MFRLRLSLALALLVVLVFIQAGFVHWGTNRLDGYVSHSRLTSDVLSELLALSADKQRLRVWAAQQLMDAGAAPEVREQLLQGMHERAAQLQDMSARYLATWSELAAREGVDVPEGVRQLADITLLLDENIVQLQSQLRRLAPLAPGARSSSVWQEITAVFDTTHGRDLRELLNAAIEHQRQAVPEARAATVQGIERLRRQAVGMAGFTLAAAVVLALQLNRRLQRPLDRLLQGTRALQAGALGHRIQLGSGDEFDRVAAHFNAMAAELQQHRAAADAARRRLEEAVQARTAELSSAHQTLHRLDQRRRQLFADLSHELRTPATAIRGEAEIALRGIKPVSEYREAMQRIVGAVEQLTGLVDDLMLVARAEADQLMIRPEPLALVPLLQQVLQQAEALAGLHGIRLTQDLAVAEGTMVHADAQRLRQAALIVLDNAIRYSHAGGEVRLKARRDGAAVSIVVSDQGIGIDPQELPVVFERFVRGARARQHRADGTGIGLSIAQAIVQAHRGRISLQSEQGKGTEVSIELTCHAEARAQVH